jgi:hypothetical protein
MESIFEAWQEFTSGKEVKRSVVLVEAYDYTKVKGRRKTRQRFRGDKRALKSLLAWHMRMLRWMRWQRLMVNLDVS